MGTEDRGRAGWQLAVPRHVYVCHAPHAWYTFGILPYLADVTHAGVQQCAVPAGVHVVGRHAQHAGEAVDRLHHVALLVGLAC